MWKQWGTTKGLLWRISAEIASNLFQPPVSMSLGSFSHIDSEYNHVLCFGRWDNSNCDTSRFEQRLPIWTCPLLLGLEPWTCEQAQLVQETCQQPSTWSQTNLLTNCKHKGEPKWVQQNSELNKWMLWNHCFE